jgi:hypothetical protein
MKKLSLATLALLLTFAFTQTEEATAQNQLGVHVGMNMDHQDMFAGVQGRFQIPNVPLQINPAVETYFIQDQTRLQVDLNALYPFGFDTVLFRPYAGAGLGIQHSAFTPAGQTARESDTQYGLNLVFGSVFGAAALRPFAEGRVTVAGDSQVALRGGVLFSF